MPEPIPAVSMWPLQWLAGDRNGQWVKVSQAGLCLVALA